MGKNCLPAARARSNRLAASIASILALSIPGMATAATTWQVTSCAESGPGSLRNVISAVTTISGDTVDLSGLTGINACANSKISLSTGEILVPQASLTIQGPGASVLTIDGTNLPGGSTGFSNSRLFTHTDDTGGTLTFNDLSLTAGHVYHQSAGYPSLGGCIYSKSSVTLIRSDLFKCSATQVGGYGASGGGIYAKGGVGLKYSSVSGNSADGGQSKGGGVHALNQFAAKYSTITDNHALGSGYGGGVFVGGNTTLIGATISGNISDKNVGGIDAFNMSPGSNTFKMTNSTISGNTSANVVGGVYTNSVASNFYYSTIAFNTAASAGASPGVSISGFFAPVTALLQSTLISNNNYIAGQDNDLGTTGVVTFTGTSANNLVRATFVNSLPADSTKFVSCPLLGPLRGNGGLTKTHALMSTSPAIDVGNNTLNLSYDQRGSASANGVIDYLRRSGPAGNPTPLADIGAFEVQQNDVIFDTVFEGCTELI